MTPKREAEIREQLMNDCAFCDSVAAIEDLLVEVDRLREALSSIAYSRMVGSADYAHEALKYDR